MYKIIILGIFLCGCESFVLSAKYGNWLKSGVHLSEIQGDKIQRKWWKHVTQRVTLPLGSDLFGVSNGIPAILFENFCVFLIHTDIVAFLILVDNGFTPHLPHFFIQ